MKIVSLLVVSFFVGCSMSYAEIYPSDWKPFVSAEGGVTTMSDSMENGSAVEVRGGTANDEWQISYGYLRQEGDTKDTLLPATLTLHTLNLGIYREFITSYGFSAKLGVNGGYTVPNLDSNASETLDNGFSGVFNGGLDYALTPSLSLGLKASYFVFKTDSHRTTRTSETDTVFNSGVPVGTVEIENESHQDNSLNLNSLVLTAGVTYRF